MSNFDEKSGLVYSITPWGQWAQTIEEVFVEVKVPEGTRSRDVKCDIKAQYMSLSVHNKEIIKGPLYLKVLSDESVWTLEDKKIIRIVLVKSDRSAASCWKLLLQDQYNSDAFTFNEMEKKLTLERFQRENPGFDFSGAEISGNYSGGGPKF